MATFTISSFNQSVVFSPTYSYSFDEIYENNHRSYTHKECIVEALREFATRSEETTKYLISTFGFKIEVTHSIHYSSPNEKERPHFNIRANGKTYHLYTIKNGCRIVGVTELLYTDFRF